MKKLSYFAAFFAAMTMFSCSNNDDPTVDPQPIGDRTVELRIMTEVTKTDEPGVNNGAKTVIHDGTIYFFDPAGGCLFSYNLTTADITGISGSTPTPVTVLNVPSAAESAMLVTNYVSTGVAGSYPVASGNTLSTLQALPVLIPTQQSSATNPQVSNVIMSGTAPITVSGSGNSAVYTSNITITPIMSRLEISRVGCKGDGTHVGDITQFRLRGIFITNAYQNSTIMNNGTSNMVPNYTTNTYYTGSFPNLSGTGYLNNYVPTTTLFPGLVHSATGNMWGYNVFPSIGASNTPNIVVMVDSIKYVDTDHSIKNWENGNAKYITVTSYLTSGSTPTAVVNFNAATVYRIDGQDGSNGPGKPGGQGGIIFGLPDLGDHPYTTTESVTCNVTVTPWNVQLIVPNL